MGRDSELPDRKPFYPYAIRSPEKREILKKEIIGGVQDGLPVADAFVCAGIPYNTYKDWVIHFQKDFTDGFRNTEFIRFMLEIAKEDKKLFRRFSKKMMEEAENGNTRILMYLAENRFGYANRRKTHIDRAIEKADSKGNKIEINIVNMENNSSDVIDTNLVDDEDG